jgi:NADH pyrophosphatase NudC (nudix superfamily)
MLQMTLSTSSPSSPLPQVSHPWYSHPDLERDRSHVLEFPCTIDEMFQEKNENIDWTMSRFIVTSKEGMWYQLLPTTSPLFLTQEQLKDISMWQSGNPSGSGGNITCPSPRLAWVGKYKDIDYWVVYDQLSMDTTTRSCSTIIKSETFTACKPLREFGDLLEHREDAAVLATAQGLVEFHKSHPFCSLCGGATQSIKAGACRKCDRCHKSVYPRLDVAAIMLVTSPCQQYALLGRKKSWPVGRYSTLAGFCEVGETLEDCCRRETFEESGVIVDPSSVTFVASQPWPFPHSLMVGFRATAIPNQACSNDQSLPTTLPNIQVDTSEMQDIQWFAKDFVRQRLDGGSTALTYQPNGKEADFHIPGKASLARVLISCWVKEQ